MKKIMAVVTLAFTAMILCSCSDARQTDSIETTLQGSISAEVDVKNGLDVTLEEIMPVIETANYNMYLIDGGDDTFQFKDGHYLNYNGMDFYEVLGSFYDVFAEKSGIADNYISSLICYKSGDELLLMRSENANYEKTEEDIFNISGDYKTITISGGIGSNPTFLSNEFEITDRTETTLTVKNTAYYSEDNDNPVQTFEYKMVFEDGMWKFLNFERWY